MPKFTLSVDDGCASDVRVAELATKYGYECVFYWPVEWHSLAYDNGYQPITYAEALSIAANFEIGSHTVTHRHLTKLSPLDSYKEIISSQLMLRGLFPKQKINKFCPPRGYVGEREIPIIEDFYDSYRLTKGKGLVHVHPNSGGNNNKPWRDCIDENTKEVWFHSWELDKFNLWDELEEVLRENSSS